MRTLKGLVLMALLATGCFRIEVYAPHGPPVKLLPRDADTSVSRQTRTWFGVLGAVPVDNTQPGEIMAREDMRAVRVRVTDTIPDALIGAVHLVFLATGFCVQTYVVEGNRPPEASAPAK